MGGKKKDRAAQAKKAKPAARGRDSEDEQSETSAMSGTSSDKLRLAQTREDVAEEHREAVEDALRVAASHETPTETPIFGPGNVFDEGDDDEIEELRTQNAELKRRLHMHDSTTGAATSKRVTWKPNSLQAMSSEAPAFAEPKDILSLRKQNCQKHIFDWLGFYSFVLRLGREERKMLTPKVLANHEKNQQEHYLHHSLPSPPATRRLLGPWATPSW